MTQNLKSNYEESLANSIKDNPKHKDLGTIIDSSLKFHCQTAAVANKTNHILGLIIQLTNH